MLCKLLGIQRKFLEWDGIRLIRSNLLLAVKMEYLGFIILITQQQPDNAKVTPPKFSPVHGTPSSPTSLPPAQTTATSSYGTSANKTANPSTFESSKATARTSEAFSGTPKSHTSFSAAAGTHPLSSGTFELNHASLQSHSILQMSTGWHVIQNDRLHLYRPVETQQSDFGIMKVSLNRFAWNSSFRKFMMRFTRRIFRIFWLWMSRPLLQKCKICMGRNRRSFARIWCLVNIRRL